MTVYKLKVNLGSPLSASDPFIHFDGFLSYAAAVEEIGYDKLKQMDEYNDEPEYFRESVPLNSIEINGSWIWTASSAIISADNGWNITKWRKRFDVDLEHQKKKTQIDIQSGKYKSYNAALPYNQIKELSFYFQGNKRKVKELLEKNVSHIGKKTSQGYGKIRKISIEETNRDSAIYDGEKTLRTLPANFFRIEPGVKIEKRAVRPPYWHPENFEFAVKPFTKIKKQNLKVL